MTELVEAYAQLQKAGANVLGAVSNMCSGTDANYVSRYYEESDEAIQRGGNLPDEPLAQRDEVRPASSARAASVAPQAGGAARGAVPVQPVQPFALCPRRALPGGTFPPIRLLSS